MLLRIVATRLGGWMATGLHGSRKLLKELEALEQEGVWPNCY